MNDPLRVDWVDASDAFTPPWSGRLGMTFAPGKRDWGMTGRHRRDLAADMATLRGTYAVDRFVLLIEDHELVALEVTALPASMAEAGIELTRHPIRDAGVPRDRPAFAALLGELRAALDRGERVVVACRGGCGRTGTLVACLLRDAGLGEAEAIAATRRARDCAIEEDTDQERFVREWTQPGWATTA